MEKLTYRDLEKITTRSFQQLVRYAVTLFGEDPEAPKSGGRQRLFEVDDAWMLYLMGVLVGDYRLRLEEANQHVLRLINEATFMGLLPSQQTERSGPAPRVVVRIHPGGVYEFRVYERAPEVVITQRGKKIDEGPAFVRFVPETALENISPGPFIEIGVTAHLRLFLNRLREVAA